MFRWEGKIFPSRSRLRCHMEGMATDTMYRHHRLPLWFLPSMGDQSREVSGFEGTAQQLPWTKAGVLLWAAHLDLSWSLTSSCYNSSVLCSCWFCMFMGNTSNRMGWFHCPPLHSLIFLMCIHLSARIREGSTVAIQRSYSIYAQPQIFSWDRLLQACISTLTTQNTNHRTEMAPAPKSFVHCTVAVWGCWLILCCCWN